MRSARLCRVARRAFSALDPVHMPLIARRTVSRAAAGLILLALVPEIRAQTPRQVVFEAVRAVEARTTAEPRQRWSAAERGDPLASLGLATLDRLEYDYDGAERRYRTLTTKRASDAITAWAHLGRAEALDTRGRMAEADSAFDRAIVTARAAHDRAAEALALLGVSFPRTVGIGVEAGLATLDSAARLLDLNDAEGQALLHQKRAVLFAVTQNPEAQREGRECLTLARRAASKRIEGHCLRALALDYKLRAVNDSGMIVVQDAERALEAAGDRSYLAETLLRESDLLLADAAYGRARVILAKARVEAEASHNELALSSVEVGIGSVLLRVGELAEAARHLARAKMLFEKQGDEGGVMMTRGWQASVRRETGDLDGARADSRATVEWFRRIGDAAEEHEALRQLSGIEMLRGDYAAAARVLADARALASREGRQGWQRALLHDEAQLALARGDLGAAERGFRRYLATRDTADHVRRYAARARLADIRARRGDLAGAERELVDATDEIDAWRASQTSRDLRVLAFQVSTSYELGVDASVARTIAALAAGGRAEAAFRLGERRRARELAGALLRAEGLRTGERAEEVTVSQQGTASAGDVVALARALPDDRTALLEYVGGEGGAPTTLFVVRQGAPVRALALPSVDSLAPEVARFTELLASGGEPRALARALGDAVLAPALPLLSGTISRLVIVPDGVLHRVPYDALLLPDGRFALERFEIALAPSATVARELWHRESRSGATRLLAFGDPRYGGSSGAGASRSPDSSGTVWTRLAGSGAEARLVARYAPASEVRTGARATARALEGADLSDVRVLHLAAHALVDDAHPARTAIALAPTEGDDGLVTPAELRALRLGADLVVLSACRTAGGTLVRGEGVQGLTAPLLAAGARAVVASAWPIGDRSTVRLVEDFYSSLALHRSVGEALRDAKLAALHDGAAPREWAAFEVIGDPLVEIPLRQPGLQPAWFLAIAIVLGVSGLAAAGYYRRTRSVRMGDTALTPPASSARTHQR